MEPTKTYLEHELQNIRAQKQKAANVFQQALGAEHTILSVLEHIRAREAEGGEESAEKPETQPSRAKRRAKAG